MSEAMKGKHWRCNVCRSVVTGVNWSEMFRGKLFHRTPGGAECRAVNFEQLNEIPRGEKVVVCEAVPVPRAQPGDETTEQKIETPNG